MYRERNDRLGPHQHASGLLQGTFSGGRPGDSSIAALFAARKAAVGCSSDVAGASAREMNTSLVSGDRRRCQGVRPRLEHRPDADLDDRA